MGLVVASMSVRGSTLWGLGQVQVAVILEVSQAMSVASLGCHSGGLRAPTLRLVSLADITNPSQTGTLKLSKSLPMRVAK